MNIQQLKSIGLTDGEIAVYTALINLGESTKTALVAKSKIAPSNLYDITNRLAEKGLISITQKNGIAHFIPSHPKHLLDFVEEKRKAIDYEKEIITKLLPSLSAAYTERDEKNSVEVFTGWNGLKTIFEDLIDSCSAKDTTYVFGAGKGEYDEQADRFFLKYSRLREEKKIKTKIIFNEELRKRKSRIDFFIKSPAYDLKFLPQTTLTEVMIYKDFACILILSHNPIGIRIENKATASSFKQQFDVLWKEAKR